MKFVKCCIDSDTLPVWFIYDESTPLSSARVYNNSLSYSGQDIRNCEIVEANSWYELDYTETKICSKKYTTGWLSYRGEFYGCDYSGHLTQAEYVHKMSEADMERAGFIKITREFSSAAKVSVFSFVKPSLKQMDWFKKNYNEFDRDEVLSHLEMLREILPSLAQKNDKNIIL